MKLFGSIKELVSAVFRKNSQEITLRPNQSVTYTAARDVQLPPENTDSVLMSATSQATMTNKTFDANGTGNSLSNVEPADFKTELLDADKALVRNASGAVISAKIANVNVDSAAGIDATKIADGSVTNTEFQYINALGSAAVGVSDNQILTNKTIDGDNNTLSDIAISSLKTVLADADKVIRRDATGAVVSGNSIPNSSALVTTDASQSLLNKTVSSTALTTGALTLPAGTEAERPGTPTNGMVRYNSTSGSFEGYANAAWSGIGGGGTTDLINQASHGFIVGDVLYINGSTYTKARADSAPTAEVVGMVSRYIDANNFELTLSGEVKGLTGLVSGEMYFLSPTTAGAVTITEPTVVGQISLPVGIASSTTTMYVAPKRGVVVGSANVQTVIPLANNTTTTVQNVSAYSAGQLTGWIEISATTPLRFYISAQFSKNGAATNWNLSYQTSGDTPPTSFSMTITSGGLIQVILPSITGFVSSSISYSLNAPAVGTTLPLSIDAGSIQTGTVAAARLPEATYTVIGASRRNRIQKKTLAVTVTASSGATVALPTLQLNNLVVGRNYRLVMHGYFSCFVNATGAAFSAVHNASQLALLYYEPVVAGSNRFMAASAEQIFTAAATTITFQFANTSGANGCALAGGLSWVILEELNGIDLVTDFT